LHRGDTAEFIEAGNRKTPANGCERPEIRKKLKSKIQNGLPILEG
jgi:hypothetical protein